MRIRHSELIKAYANYFKLDASQVKGLCFGFSSVFLDAYFAGDKALKELLLLLTVIKSMADESAFNTKQSAFFEQIAVYQSPDDFGFIFNKDMRQSYMETHALISGYQSHPTLNARGLVGVKEDEFTNLLGDLEKNLEGITPKARIALGISNLTHQVSVIYQKGKGWSLIDINYFDSSLKWQKKEDLSRSLFNYDKSCIAHASLHAILLLEVFSTHLDDKISNQIKETIRSHQALINPNITTHAKTTPIMKACSDGFFDVVRYLIYRGADVNKADDRGRISLHVAANGVNPDIVALLLEAGACKDKADRQDGFTPLILACMNNSIEIAKLLLQYGANKDKACKVDGATPLLYASNKGYFDIVKLLLQYGANKDLASKNDNLTPLFLASQGGYTDIVNLLLQYGADTEQAATSNGATPLIYACEQGWFDIVKLLLQYGAEIGKKTKKYGYTPLLYASLGGYFDIAKILIQHGADIEKTTCEGVTPLLFAVSEGHFDIVELLIKQGANINKASKNGGTPLLAASQKGHFEIVRLLLQYGADTTIKFHERTALDIAKENNHSGIETLLLEHTKNKAYLYQSLFFSKVLSPLTPPKGDRKERMEVPTIIQMSRV